MPGGADAHPYFSRGLDRTPGFGGLDFAAGAAGAHRRPISHLGVVGAVANGLFLAAPLALLWSALFLPKLEPAPTSSAVVPVLPREQRRHLTMYQHECETTSGCEPPLACLVDKRVSRRHCVDSNCIRPQVSACSILHGRDCRRPPPARRNRLAPSPMPRKVPPRRCGRGVCPPLARVCLPAPRARCAMPAGLVASATRTTPMPVASAPSVDTTATAGCAPRRRERAATTSTCTDSGLVGSPA